jgi:dTDP-3-amino-3,4,6-trideoxy-alpha-D-glucose transaminase
MNTIAVADPHASFAASRSELVAAFEAVLDGGSYILGEQVAAFELEWARFCDVDFAVGVSSGTDALALALRACGVGPGDEVLVPAMTAVATWMAVSQIGARPVGVDIEPTRSCIDPDCVRAALGPKTRAIVAVHLFGRPADMPALAEIAAQAGLPLVEDAAQAHGATLAGRTVGSLATIAAFSFYPTKNLGAIGDAGAVTTSDPALADRVRLLREYGWRTRLDSELVGVNARLDELQAALLRVMLQRLQGANTRRREIAGAYLRGLSGIGAIEFPMADADSESSWHQFVVSCASRDALAERLSQAAVGTAIHYPTLPAATGAYAPEGWRPGAFPVAERHAVSALSLPINPQLTDAQVSHVIRSTREAAVGL